MSIQAVLAPVFVQVALTFGLLFWMGLTRVAAFRAGEVRFKDIALGQRSWPPRIQQIANAFQNQFELPVLFYALVAFALITRKADFLFVVLSWLYIAARLAHASIHVTTNHVVRRFQVFVVGAIVLLVMWIVFAARLLLPVPDAP